MSRLRGPVGTISTSHSYRHGLLILMLTVSSVAGCADRPQPRHDETPETCVVPRGGFHCENQAKQEENFMKFEQQGHQLP
jgi:hypothetical protein